MTIWKGHEAQYDAQMRAVRQSLSSLPRVDVELSLSVGWASTYDQLFSDDLDIQSEDNILDRAVRYGRILVAGRGGSGKTFLLHRLAREAVSRGWIPLIVNLNNWKGSDYDEWSSWRDQPGGGAAFLLDRFTSAKITATQLDLLPPTVQKLILVDGLNEVSATQGQEILTEIDRLVRDQIQMSAIVTDRLTRRQLPSPQRWRLCVIQPLSDVQVKQFPFRDKAGDTIGASHRIPFFLDVIARGGGVRTIGEHISKKAALSNEELQIVASAAFDIYSRCHARTFPPVFVSERASPAIVSRLLAAGFLETDGERMQFSHHLIHDYLAAIHVAAMSDDEWTAETLDTISFRASFFDGIGFVLMEVKRGRSDAFLRRVYDWNLYAAGYAVNEVQNYEEKLSREMLIVILAMLGEKRFDIVLATSERASDALLLSHVDVAKLYSRAHTLDEILSAVRTHESDVQWFNEWRDIFTLGAECGVDDGLLVTLFEADSVKGWTLANVLKRTVLTSAQQAALRKGWMQREPTIQWRIAHVLGAYPSDENIDVLLALLNGGVDSVRYGAVRSLVEVAALGERELRERIVSKLVEMAEKLYRDHVVRDELKRALMIAPGRAPAGWFDIVRRIAREFFVREERIESRDVWSQFVAVAETRYGEHPN